MRIGLSANGFGWLNTLDYKKLILIAFLLRFIFAAGYDIFISLTGNDILLPDGKFYSIRGRYVALLINGYGSDSFTRDMVPPGDDSLDIFLGMIRSERGAFPAIHNEVSFFVFIIGILYFVFGYFPLAVRVFNIVLSIGSTYLIFKIAKRQFGDLTANLFLLIALFLPTQFIYSATLSKDFIRMFVLSLVLWLIYGGVLCSKK